MECIGGVTPPAKTSRIEEVASHPPSAKARGRGAASPSSVPAPKAGSLAAACQP